MRKILLISFLFIFCSGSFAQISFNTGSVELDANLNIINTNAKSDLTSYKSELNISYNLPIVKFDYMLSINMQPAEIFLVVEIARLSRKSVDMVIESYKTHKSKGWGYIAKEMGIKPGSDEFHALKGKSKEKSHKKSSNSPNNKGNNGKSKGKKK